MNILLFIRETFTRLYTVKIYSKFNIITAFNKVRIKLNNEEKTTFLTRYKLFEYIIIPFGFYNILSIF